MLDKEVTVHPAKFTANEIASFEGVGVCSSLGLLAILQLDLLLRRRFSNELFRRILEDDLCAMLKTDYDL